MVHAKNLRSKLFSNYPSFKNEVKNDETYRELLLAVLKHMDGGNIEWYEGLSLLNLEAEVVNIACENEYDDATEMIDFCVNGW